MPVGQPINGQLRRGYISTGAVDKPSLHRCKNGLEPKKSPRTQQASDLSTDGKLPKNELQISAMTDHSARALSRQAPKSRLLSCVAVTGLGIGSPAAGRARPSALPSGGYNPASSLQWVDEEDMAYQPTLVVFSGGTAFNSVAGEPFCPCLPVCLDR